MLPNANWIERSFLCNNNNNKVYCCWRISYDTTVTGYSSWPSEELTLKMDPYIDLLYYNTVMSWDHYFQIDKTSDPELLFFRLNARKYRQKTNNYFILESLNGLFNCWACLTAASYSGGSLPSLFQPRTSYYYCHMSSHCLKLTLCYPQWYTSDQTSGRTPGQN